MQTKLMEEEARKAQLQVDGVKKSIEEGINARKSLEKTVNEIQL